MRAIASPLAPILIFASVSAAQDVPLGDVARAARTEKSQAPHTSKVLTNEDFGPHLEPVHENESVILVFGESSKVQFGGAVAC
jgi:hypothetical protein